jgi:hypothetical protein
LAFLYDKINLVAEVAPPKDPKAFFFSSSKQVRPTTLSTKCPFVSPSSSRRLRLEPSAKENAKVQVYGHLPLKDILRYGRKRLYNEPSVIRRSLMPLHLGIRQKRESLQGYIKPFYTPKSSSADCKVLQNGQ